MTTRDAGARASPHTPSILWLAPPLYAVTMFVSALLLFALQPMFAKMVLPRLGGGPSVWSVAMVFFQGALLMGYGSAHLLGRMVPPRRAALTHLIVLAVAASTLPIGVAAGFDMPPASGVAFWLIGLFAASIGLPFVALSASAPLLQHWFASSGHRQARNPYVLYGASNLGSFAALLAYPFVVEPLLALRDQAHLWSIGFAAIALLIAVAGLFVERSGAADVAAATTDEVRPSFVDRMRWMALAAVPSGLVIAVTSFVTTDLASAPFVWVFPLAMYLATFVAVFRDRPWFDHATVVRLTPTVVAPVAVTLLGMIKPLWLPAIGFNLLTFAVLTLVCHGELYRRRPAPAHLTEFYLWISVGGALGGAFAGLIAPYVFNNIYEYPILIAAALLALPGMFAGGPSAFLRQAGPVLAAVAAVGVARMASGSDLPHLSANVCRIAAVLLIAFIFLRRKQPPVVFALVVLAFVFTGAWTPGLNRVATTRSFFGVHQVTDSTDGRYRVLTHGTTIHGAERLRSESGDVLAGRPEPLTYYYFGGPISESIEATRAALGGLKNVAVVGLGAGSLACHRKDPEHWTFYEIDPEVIRIARDARMFRFLPECAPSASIVLGDARLTLAASGARYDLIVLDAFSSDAVPGHLLTQEAFAIYLSHLAPHGVLVAHVSNRHLDLVPVVAAAAKAKDLIAFLRDDGEGDPASGEYKVASTVVALARDPADLGDLPTRASWRQLEPDAGMPPWTDDYSNILGAMMRHKFGY
ncbi:MAG TPA: fused MFS/spermidine synthase [Xanthobacteraceae bacterium]|nr:fused MFS/spermidine synthase [Xanthobacteraceae bacterium]